MVVLGLAKVPKIHRFRWSHRNHYDQQQALKEIIEQKLQYLFRVSEESFEKISFGFGL